jgi:LPS O-antigen subunit length determinant protein (WzzB/FepE family)
MDHKTGKEISNESKLSEKLQPSLNEMWDMASQELNDRVIQELKSEFQADKEYIKKYGKLPEARNPDGKINMEYINYALKRDFGIEPENYNHDSYENFSWGGLIGEEAFIAYYNCE